MNKNLGSGASEVKIAMYLAMVIRNEMEDFHCEHLSDRQMAELNPIVRSALLNGLHALRHRENSPAARAFVAFNLMSIPDYWEEPTLKRSLVKEPECDKSDLFDAGTVSDALDARMSSQVSELRFDIDDIDAWL